MKELEDYHWFSQVLRNYQTDYIGFVVRRFNIYEVFVQYIQKLGSTEKSMFDLCSGSGEPALSIFKSSKCFNRLFLSDKYPNAQDTYEAPIHYIPDPIDVLTLEFEKGNVYTMFNAIHHFKDEDKKRIVQHIMEKGASAYFVEILEPTFFFFLKVMVLTTFGVFFFNPFVKPFSWKRLFFTYIIPINIFTIFYDGIISVLKSRSLHQYEKLYAEMANVKVMRLKKGISSLVVIQVSE